MVETKLQVGPVNPADLGGPYTGPTCSHMSSLLFFICPLKDTSSGVGGMAHRQSSSNTVKFKTEMEAIGARSDVIRFRSLTYCPKAMSELDGGRTDANAGRGAGRRLRRLGLGGEKWWKVVRLRVYVGERANRSC